MTNIRLPRLLDRNLKELSRLDPLSLSIEANLAPLSTAEMTLAPDAPSLETGQFMELFTLQGSMGYFRVEQVEQSTQTAFRISLSHSLVTLADALYTPSQTETALPAPQIFREILSQQSMWQSGSVDVPEDVLVTLSGSGTLLDALAELMDALPDYHLAFDQSTSPWTLHLLALSDTCATECRLTRNLHSLTIESDRSTLCTQLYLPGIEAPLTADTVDRWGVVSATLSADSNLTEQELFVRGQQYLDQHKNPQLTITMEAFDLCQITGSSLDSFHLGHMCRVCLPESATILEQRIITLSWPDVYGTPDLLLVTLANKQSSASTMLSSLIVDTTLVKKKVTQSWEELAEQKELIITAQEQLALLSQKITLHASELLSLSAGVNENAANITLANDRITANADAIALKADQASLDLANGRITANADEIALKADRIDLQGLVTATELETVKASISNLTSGLTTATVINSNVVNGDQVNGTYGSFDSLTHNGALVSQRSITMGSLSSVGKALSTGGELDLQHSHAVTVNDDGTITLGEVSAEGGNFKIADTKAYKDGVSAAANAVYFVSTSWSAGRLTVKLSNDRTKVVTLTQGTTTSDNKIPVLDNDSGATAYTVDASDVYQDGYDAGAAAGGDVTLSKKWANGVFTVTASNGQTATTTISKGTESLSGNTYSIPIMYDTSGETGYTVTVDASARYTAGKNSVTLSKKWSGGVLTVTASNGKTSTAQLAKGTESWDGDTVSVPVLDGSGSTGYTITVDAYERYKAGWNEFRAACTHLSNVYTISENSPGTLYMLVNGSYTSVGSSWVKVSPYSYAYKIPSAIS